MNYVNVMISSIFLSFPGSDAPFSRTLSTLGPILVAQYLQVKFVSIITCHEAPRDVDVFSRKSLAISGLSDLWHVWYGQFQVTVFSLFSYVLLCNHEYIHYLNHRQAKDYITRRNETERKL